MMTLEEAQAEILALKEKVAELTNERDSLSQDKTTLTGELEIQRKLNQDYFNKLNAQYSHDADDEKEDEAFAVTSCEDFAKSLEI